MKVDPNAYDYVMYVDASGDDGFKFGNGSSSCFAAAALLVKQEDIAANLDILDQIKKLVGAKPTDEVKYSKIRRHRNGAEAMSLLKGIRGQMSSYIVFKKEVDQSRYIGNKHMSVVCHAMALHSLDCYEFADGAHILVAIDRMKQTEEEPLGEILVGECEKNTTRLFTEDVVFMDSRDRNSLLIQIADLLCGTIREHFEQYETNPDMIYFKLKCPPCKQVRMIRKAASHPMCIRGRSIASRIQTSKNLQNILCLLPKRGTADMMDYFFMEPSYMMDQHFYMICKKKK